LKHARDAMFTTLVIAELMRAFGARSNGRTIFEVGLLSNLWLFLIIALSFSLQVTIHQVPVLRSLFSIEPLSLEHCVVWIGLGFIPLMILEIKKILRRRGDPTVNPQDRRTL